MAPTKKTKEMVTSMRAEIFYFSEEGGCSASRMKHPSATVPPSEKPEPSEEFDEFLSDREPDFSKIDEEDEQQARKKTPAPSLLAERMNRSERTRAARANSLKGSSATKTKASPVARSAVSESTQTEFEFPIVEGQDDLVASGRQDMLEPSEKTESFDLQGMPIDASMMVETDLDSDDLEEIEPESTLIEELSIENETASVEAEFARMMEKSEPPLSRMPQTSKTLDATLPEQLDSADQDSQKRIPKLSRSEAVPPETLQPIQTPADQALQSLSISQDEEVLIAASICLLKSAQAQQHYRQKLTPLLTKGSGMPPKSAWASAALFGQDLFATGRPLPAQKVFERLVAQTPTEAFPYAMLASLHLAQGADDVALELCEQALELDSTDLCALLGRAEVHLRAANPVEALVDVKTALNQATLDESPLLPRAQAMMALIQKLISFLG